METLIQLVTVLDRPMPFTLWQYVFLLMVYFSLLILEKQKRRSQLRIVQPEYITLMFIMYQRFLPDKP